MGRLRKWVLPYYPYQEHQLPLYWYPSEDPTQLGHDLSILEYGVNHILNLLQQRSRSLFSIFTICFPKMYPCDTVQNNSFFSNAMELFLRGITFTHPSYLWVRERHDSQHQHYHLALWVDGSVCKSFITLGEVLECRWCNTIGVYAPGLVEYRSAEYNKVHLVRNRSGIEEISQAVYKLSYLSKLYTKELDLSTGVKRWHHNR